MGAICSRNHKHASVEICFLSEELIVNARWISWERAAWLRIYGRRMRQKRIFSLHKVAKRAENANSGGRFYHNFSVSPSVDGEGIDYFLAESTLATGFDE